MKKLIINIFILLFTMCTFAQKKVILKPILEKKAVKIISGKRNVYYALNINKSIKFSVKGYDKLVVYSRERINKEALGYTILYDFDNKISQKYAVAKKRKDYRSVYVDKKTNSTVALFNKKNITVSNQASIINFKTANLSNVDIKIAAFKNGKKTFLKPINDVDKVFIVTGKPRNYYKLNSKTPTVIETNKEGELIIYTRKRLLSNSLTNYSFSYQIEGLESNIVKINDVKKSTQSVFKSLNIKELPSTYNKTIIKVDDIYQKIVFSSNFPVDARFVFKKTIKKNGWEELESFQGEIVPLLVKNKKTIKEYTRITSKKPFKFSVDKAEEIKIFIRGEFKYYMHANNDYEIVLRDNGKIVNTYKLSCYRSNIMQYKFNDEFIPGTLDKFTIKVPLGKHKYSISINNKDKTALIRVMKKVQSEVTFNKLTN